MINSLKYNRIFLTFKENHRGINGFKLCKFEIQKQNSYRASLFFIYSTSQAKHYNILFDSLPRKCGSPTEL